MKEKSHKPSKEDLLRELESIRESLSEEDSEMQDKENDMLKTEGSAERDDPMAENIDIPEDANGENDEASFVLEIPEDKQEIEEGDQPTPLAEDDNDSSSEDLLTGDMENDEDLLEQQSLFNENSMEKTSEHIAVALEETAETPSENKEVRENPFLPKHVREKLEHERAFYQKEIDQANLTPNISRKRTVPEKHGAIIDDLISLYLPRIERELRHRLEESLNAPTDEE